MKDLEKLLGLNTDRFTNPMLKEISKLSSLDKRITSFLPSNLSSFLIEKQRSEYLNSYSGLYKYLPQNFYQHAFPFNDLLKKNDILLQNIYPFVNSNYDFCASYRSDYTKHFGSLINNLIFKNDSFISLPNYFPVINSFSKAMSLSPIFSEYPNLLKLYNNSFLTDNLTKWLNYSKISENIFSQDYFQSLESDPDTKINFSALDDLSVTVNDYNLVIDESDIIAIEDFSIKHFKFDMEADSFEEAINILISKVTELDSKIEKINSNTGLLKTFFVAAIIAIMLKYFDPILPQMNNELIQPNHNVTKQLLKQTQKFDMDKFYLNQYRFVNIQELYVMGKKSKKSQVLGRLYYGWYVKMILKKKNWSFIQYEDSMGFIIEGWVLTRYLQQIK